MSLALGRIGEESPESWNKENKQEDEQDKEDEQEQGETQQVQKDEEENASPHPGRLSGQNCIGALPCHYQTQLKEKPSGPWLL